MSVDQPFVSILITSYNYAPYLTEAIESALNQTYPNTEVIVVDDGSTDKSPEIIASYGDKIIPVYKENGGQGSAYNAGFALTQGNIVCFLDSDDVWLPQKVEQVVEAFNTYPGAVVAYHQVQSIDKVSQALGKPWPPYKSIRGDISSQVARTGGWWPFPPSSALSYRREFLCKVMNVPDAEGKYRQAADTYLADLAPFCGEVVGINRVLSYFRMHDSNNWSNPRKVSKEGWAIRELQNQEFRVKMLNLGLKRLGVEREVNLNDRLPYQLTKYELGKPTSLFCLSQLTWQNPWEHRLISKLKAIALLWLKRGN